jgi:hypothetical protein
MAEHQASKLSAVRVPEPRGFIQASRDDPTAVGAGIDCPKPGHAYFVGSWGDYDGDGYLDLFVASPFEKDLLYWIHHRACLEQQQTIARL